MDIFLTHRQAVNQINEEIMYGKSVLLTAQTIIVFIRVDKGN